MSEWINNFKCRASAVSKMMSNKQGFAPITENQLVRLDELRRRNDGEGKPLTENMKQELAELLVKEANKDKIVLSDTCIEYLMEVYAWETQGMIPVGKESMDLLQMKKGKMMEEQALRLLSVIRGEVYSIHKERISNDYLSGEIDAYLGTSVYEAQEVADIKNAFDYPGFLKKINNGLENGQQQQLQAYGDITGAKILSVDNVLVDNPDEIIQEMQFRIAKKLNVIDTASPDFTEEWGKWLNSMIFEKIPIHQRVYRIKVEPFTDFERQKVYDRVKVCREWLNNFHEQYQNLNLS